MDIRVCDDELDHYLSVTAEDIKNAVSKFVNVDNRVVLDIIPASQPAEATPPASPASPGDAQPTAPAPQIPEKTTLEPETVQAEAQPQLHPETTEEVLDSTN